MEEFLDEWNGYVFSGEFTGQANEGTGDFEYVVFVYSETGFLFTLRLRATNNFLESQGFDLKGRPYRIAALMKAHALRSVRQRIREADFRPLEEYQDRLE
jgi:hypothetical protein